MSLSSSGLQNKTKQETSSKQAARTACFVLVSCLAYYRPWRWKLNIPLKHRCYIPDDRTLHNHHCENSKSNIYKLHVVSFISNEDIMYSFHMVSMPFTWEEYLNLHHYRTVWPSQMACFVYKKCDEYYKIWSSVRWWLQTWLYSGI
jgi:hypothetical protein